MNANWFPDLWDAIRMRRERGLQPASAWIGLRALGFSRTLHSVLLFVLLVLAGTIGAAPRAATDRPNVIVVFLDDAGYGDFSITGNPTIRTPQLERMAREGLRFTQFYCATAACSASTGRIRSGGAETWPAASGSITRARRDRGQRLLDAVSVTSRPAR